MQDGQNRLNAGEGSREPAMSRCGGEGLPPRIPPLALRDPGCLRRSIRLADRAAIFMAESCAPGAGGRVVGTPRTASAEELVLVDQRTPR